MPFTRSSALASALLPLLTLGAGGAISGAAAVETIAGIADEASAEGAASAGMAGAAFAGPPTALVLVLVLALVPVQSLPLQTPLADVAVVAVGGWAAAAGALPANILALAASYSS